MGVRHVVLLRFADGVESRQVDALRQGLAGLPAAIPEIRSYTLGSDLGVSEGTWDFAIAAEFDDTEGYLRYRSHPAHVAVINDLLNPIVAERAAVQHGI